MATTFVEGDGEYELMAFDPFHPDFREKPELHHAMMFDASPGFIDVEGVPSAFIATYDQVLAVLRNFKAFSSLKPKGLPGMERFDFFNGLPVMNYSDPPDHTRRRKVVNPAFTPKRTEVLLQNAEIVIDRLIDQLLRKDGEFDAMAELTKPLSIDTLLRRFMAIADEDHSIFMDYVKSLALLDKVRPGDPKPQPYLDAWAAGAQWCREQQALAREGKCDNLVGVIAASAEGGGISDDEMMAMMIVLLIGGVSTVAGAAAVTMMYLAKHPEIAERIRREPALAEQHLEESLRMDPPVSLVMRFCATPTEVGGRLIPQGMPIYCMIATACHDPAKFPGPYVFDVDRANAKDHLAFGQGMHTCIGNAITRNVIPLLVRKVVERMPNLRLADRTDAVQWDTMTARARHISQLWMTCQAGNGAPAR